MRRRRGMQRSRRKEWRTCGGSDAGPASTAGVATSTVRSQPPPGAAPEVQVTASAARRIKTQRADQG